MVVVVVVMGSRLRCDGEWVMGDGRRVMMMVVVVIVAYREFSKIL